MTAMSVGICHQYGSSPLNMKNEVRGFNNIYYLEKYIATSMC